MCVIMELSKTPYEKFLQENLEEKRKRLDSLYTEFARANTVKKQIIKRQIDDVKQNIEILSRDIEKYGHGLTWLREASKNRDTKSEHLEKVQIAEAENKPATPPIARPSGAAQAVSTRPTVGTPVGTPRPTIGKPVGTKPVVGAPSPQASQPVKKTEQTSEEKKEESA